VQPQSIAASIMTAAQLGLEPGINGQGYLIPYKKTCTFVPGWKGLVDLVARSGRATVWTGAVARRRVRLPARRRAVLPARPGDGDDDEQFTHVYAIGRVRDASMAVIEVWTRGKVEKHLKRYNKVGERHYAKANENNFEMYARKVALLQVLKYMPASIELANAIAVSNAPRTARASCSKATSCIDPETGECPSSTRPPSPASCSPVTTSPCSTWPPTRSATSPTTRRASG
jgi:recombination protein RecT